MLVRRWWLAALLVCAGVAGCGSEGRYRRTLPTDQLAPWSTRDDVTASLERSGWCRDTKREKHPGTLVYGWCSSDPVMVLLVHFRQERLIDVTLLVPTPPYGGGPSWKRTQRAVATELFDALAVELYQRYGEPARVGQGEAYWRASPIHSVWLYLNGSVVIENHHFDAGAVAPGAMVAGIASSAAARALVR